MRRLVVVALAFAVAALILAIPAQAIVHAVTPIVCNGAVAASGGKAGGAAAFPVVSTNPSPGPPMPAQGLAHSKACPDS